MNFEADAFISYAHLDNIELVQGHKGWVANLQRALAIRVAQKLGKEARVWWDAKLQGNDVFDTTLVERLRRVAALVSVVSPRYVRSEWGLKEVHEFCRAAEEQGGVRVQDKARIFKVLKTDVPLAEQPPELQCMLGYEFYKIDPATGKVRELDEIFGADAERDFWLKLDDLAHDVCVLLHALELVRPADGTAATTAGRGAVYLAETTNDLQDERETLRRDLQQHGFKVLPDCTLPVEATSLAAAVKGYLAESCLSIHLVGQAFSFVPEGSEQSVIDLQNELAIERSGTGKFSRLVWIPPALQVADERQQELVQRLRLDPRHEEGSDLLETPLEALRTLVHARLTPTTPLPVPAGPPRESQTPSVYLIYDRRDTEAIAPWSTFLFDRKTEVIKSLFEGDEADIREYHEESLRSCDAAVIFYGSAPEVWLRRKLREVQKSVGYGRLKPSPAVGICLIAPRTPDKEQFRTHEALLIPQWDGVLPEPWQPFLDRVTGVGGSPAVSGG